MSIIPKGWWKRLRGKPKDHITITFTSVADPAAIGRELARYLDEHKRRGGRL